MTSTLSSAQHEAIEWLKQEFAKRHLRGKIYDHLAQPYTRVVAVPVYLSGNESEPEKKFDAHDIASTLQDIEDSWNFQEPEPQAPLFLKPAAGKFSEELIEA